MEFYQDMGAVPMDEWTTFRLTGEALDRLAAGQEPLPLAARAKASAPGGSKE
jgi:hypothetical protein